MKTSKICRKLEESWAHRSSASLIQYYRKKGVSIGDRCIFRSSNTVYIDTMRPSLVSIGNDVDMNRNFTIMTHDFSHKVFVPLYGEFLSSSGPVSIGNNVYFGVNVTILKSVSIGDNCIIGACSVVTKSIPSNSVAVGNPCRVICSIDEYYQKRKSRWIDEAIYYAQTIRNNEHREPVVGDFVPEFGLYIDSSNITEADSKFIRHRMKEKYDFWIKNHKAEFSSFQDFLNKTK